MDAKEEAWGIQYSFYCPGCKYHHAFDVRHDGGRPNWQFDGNLERPTFTPSLVVCTSHKVYCHLFLTDGVLNFLSDSAHSLAGQKVPLESNGD